MSGPEIPRAPRGWHGGQPAFEVYCLSGSLRHDVERLNQLRANLPEMKERAEIYRARRSLRLAAETDADVAAHEGEMAELQKMADYAGDLLEHDAVAVRRRLDDATIALNNAIGSLDTLEGLKGRVAKPVFDAGLVKLQKEADQARMAHTKAERDWNEMQAHLAALRKRAA